MSRTKSQLFPFGTEPVEKFGQSGPYFFSNFGFWLDTNLSYPDAGLTFLRQSLLPVGSWDSADVLEIASGLGGTISYLANNFPVRSLTAINLPGEQSEFAKNLWEFQNIKVDFISDSWEKIQSLNGNQFSHILTIDSIYHFENIHAVFSEIFRLLKPNGYFIFTTVTIKQYPIKLKWLLKIMGIPSENLKTDKEFIAIFKHFKFDQISNREVTKEVLEGFETYCKTKSFYLKSLGLILGWMRKLQKLEYRFFVIQKSN